MNVARALNTAECESTFVYNKVHSSSKEYSVGIFQINLKAHPDITYEQAANPVWNINWAIEHMAAGHQGWWTCWNMVAYKQNRV